MMKYCSILPLAPKPQRRLLTVYNIKNNTKTIKNSKQSILQFSFKDDSLLSYAAFECKLNDELVYNEISSILQQRPIEKESNIDAVPRSTNALMKNHDFFEKNCPISTVH